MVAIVMRVDVDGVGQRLLQGFMTLYEGVCWRQKRLVRWNPSSQVKTGIRLIKVHSRVLYAQSKPFVFL